MLKLNNTVNGDLTIYNFDSHTTDALLLRETKAKKEYVNSSITNASWKSRKKKSIQSKKRNWFS